MRAIQEIIVSLDGIPLKITWCLSRILVWELQRGGFRAKTVDKDWTVVARAKSLGGRTVSLRDSLLHLVCP
eukprot:1679616-Rhodomonas_salina.3